MSIFTPAKLQVEQIIFINRDYVVMKVRMVNREAVRCSLMKDSEGREPPYFLLFSTATPLGGDCRLRRILFPKRAARKMGNTSSIPAFFVLSLVPKSLAVSLCPMMRCCPTSLLSKRKPRCTSKCSGVVYSIHYALSAFSGSPSATFIITFRR